MKIRLLKYVLVFVNVFSFAQTHFENDSIIFWNENEKITWNDFKSENRIHDYKFADAVISTSLYVFPNEINSENINKLVILAKMNKNLSWVKMKSESGLKHEQGHFDITEIFARKVRKELKFLIGTGNKVDVLIFSEIFHKIDDELWTFQIEYEESTERGNNLIIQNKWNKKINLLLEEYKDFKLEEFNIDDN